mmetsp:Transcript_20615/g.72797  ORF Transcript_20615/g.72797 Transcript_20615/m.72797 type:complete len:202 (+) Transcript_20615:210-815(+)
MRLGLALALRQSRQHSLALLRLQRRLLVVVPRSLALEPPAHARDRVVLAPPRLELVGRAVPRAVVAGAVVAQAVRHRLHHHGAVVLQRQRLGGLCRLVHGEQVVAVTPHARHAVASGAGDEAIAAHLLRNGRRDRKAVVADEEDGRAVQRRREVERGVEVALARGAVAEVADCDVVGLAAALHLERVRRAGRLRQLRRQRR